MDAYLKPKTSGTWFRFPIMPDRINVKSGAKVVALNVIKTGEVKIPRGITLTGYSWNGVFPGEHMSGMPFVFDWKAPPSIIQMLRQWQEEGTTLTLLVTELSINADVFIESLNYEYYGQGDCSYTITLTIRRMMTVSIMPKPLLPDDTPDAVKITETYQTGTIKRKCDYYNGTDSKKKKLGKLAKKTEIILLSKSGKWYKFKSSAITQASAWVKSSYVKVTGSTATEDAITMKTGNTAAQQSGNATYTVKSGDTLYTIAKAKLGKGTRYTELYSLNQTAIDALNKGKSVNKYTIYVGTILKLPTA